MATFNFDEFLRAFAASEMGAKNSDGLRGGIPNKAPEDDGVEYDKMGHRVPTATYSSFVEDPRALATIWKELSTRDAEGNVNYVLSKNDQFGPKKDGQTYAGARGSGLVRRTHRRPRLFRAREETERASPFTSEIIWGREIEGNDYG